MIGPSLAIVYPTARHHMPGETIVTMLSGGEFL
jgi:hypothetical protein